MPRACIRCRPNANSTGLSVSARSASISKVIAWNKRDVERLGLVKVDLLALGMLKGGSLGVAGTLAASLGGMLLLFIGAAMLVPIAVPVIARIVGWPAARFAGIPGRLARDNAIRNPGRTASTAAALMIGIALVSAIAIGAAIASWA